jgi:hypothetical protein
MTSIEIEAYSYTDDAEEVVFQVVRYDPKGFNQRRPDGNGGWIYDLEGVEKVPYRLAKVIASDIVYVVEGERDVHTIEMLGLVGTTNAGGSLNWESSYNKFFQGKHVVILPDQDAAGWRHGGKVARELEPVALSLKLINLPAGTKGDVTDWVRAGKMTPRVGRAALEALVEGSGPWTPATGDKERYEHAEAIPAGVIPAGKRHAALVSLAGSIWNRIPSKNVLFAAIQSLNQDHCCGKYDDKHLWEIVEWTATHEVKNPLVADGNGEAFVFATVNAMELRKMKFDPYPWAVDQMIPAIGVAILAGRPKEGKSWMAQQLAIAVANGSKALGRFDTRKGRVFFIGLEDNNRRMQQRFDLLQADDDSRANIDVAYDIPALAPKGIAALDNYLSAANPSYRVVVIDTFVSALGLGQRKTTDPFREHYEEIRMLRALAEKHKIGVLLIHHTRKPAKDDQSEPIDQIMGTTGLTASADNNIVIAPRKGVGLVLAVKGKDTDLSNELAIKFDLADCSGWTVLGNASRVVDIAAGRRAIIDLLKASGGLEPHDIAKHLQKPEGTIRSSLARMVADAQVVKSGKTYEVAGHERQQELPNADYAVNF